MTPDVLAWHATTSDGFALRSRDDFNLLGVVVHKGGGAWPTELSCARETGRGPWAADSTLVASAVPTCDCASAPVPNFFSAKY